MVLNDLGYRIIRTAARYDLGEAHTINNLVEGFDLRALPLLHYSIYIIFIL